MSFINQDYLINLIWVIPAIFIISIFANRRRKKIIDNFANPALQKTLITNLNHKNRFIKRILLIFSIIFTIIAFARPWYGEKISEKIIANRDVIICLDVSKSMLAKDIVPNRLAHAKLWIKNLVEQCPGDRFGLVTFAGEALLECPLTSSKNNIFEYLNSTDTDTILLGGTNIATALNTAFQALKNSEGNNRAIILITDGDELQGNTKKVISEIKEKKIPIFTVGIGDINQPGVIQFEDGKILRDKQNNPIISKLNEKGLIEIAQETNGIYVRSTIINPQVEPIVEKVLEISPENNSEMKENLKVDRYHIPLILALFSLLLMLLLSERKKIIAPILFFCLFTEDSLAQEVLQAPPTENAPSENAPKINQELVEKIKKLEAEIEKNQKDKDLLNFEIATIYQKESDFEKAKEFYNKIEANAANEIISGQLNNLAAIEIELAAKEIYQNPENSLNVLNNAADFIKNAIKNCTENDEEVVKKLQNNLKLLAKYRKTAEEIKKIMEILKKSLEETIKNLIDAKNEQISAKEVKKIIEFSEISKKTTKSLKISDNSFKTALQIFEKTEMPEESLRKLQQVPIHIKNAESLANKLEMPLTENIRKENIDKTIKEIDEALKILGVKPPEQGQENQQDKKDDKNKQEKEQQENQQNQPQDGKKGEEEKSQEDEKQKDSADEKNEQKNKEREENESKKQEESKENSPELSDEDLKQIGEKKDGEKGNEKNIAKENKKEKQDFDNVQMEGLLQEMQNREQKLKEELKKIQQQHMRNKPQNEKNW